MKVKFKLAWQTYSVGDIIEPPKSLRTWLLSNGYVLPVEDDPPIVKQLQKRKRGRPRKHAAN